ncbi:MAG: SAM-dependent methyltransferase [Saprospiraceae bacterium]
MVKGTLSKYRGKEANLRNVYFRPVLLKDLEHISCTFRYTTQDQVKNYRTEEFAGILEKWLRGDFQQVDLITQDTQYTLKIGKSGEAALFQNKLSQPIKAEIGQHDREKESLIDPAAPYLQPLGISSSEGKVLGSHQRKFRQINHYIELLGPVLEREFEAKKQRGEAIHIADMGSGKGYLTFALYDYLTRSGFKVIMSGIEIREKLVDFGNDLAQSLAYTGLVFRAGDIADIDLTNLDVLIALHACDTATDLALAKGVKSNAKVLIVAPCCQKQVRKDFEANEWIQPLTRHGILTERLCEWLTDGLRALILESQGYSTQVMEFISVEHTPKNMMLLAIKRDVNPNAKDQIAAIMQNYGLKRHALLDMLAEGN